MKVIAYSCCRIERQKLIESICYAIWIHISHQTKMNTKCQFAHCHSDWMEIRHGFGSAWTIDDARAWVHDFTHLFIWLKLLIDCKSTIHTQRKQNKGKQCRKIAHIPWLFRNVLPPKLIDDDVDSFSLLLLLYGEFSRGGNWFGWFADCCRWWWWWCCSSCWPWIWFEWYWCCSFNAWFFGSTVT